MEESLKPIFSVLVTGIRAAHSQGLRFVNGSSRFVNALNPIEYLKDLDEQELYNFLKDDCEDYMSSSVSLIRFGIEPKVFRDYVEALLKIVKGLDSISTSKKPFFVQGDYSIDRVLSGVLGGQSVKASLKPALVRNIDYFAIGDKVIVTFKGREYKGTVVDIPFDTAFVIVRTAKPVGKGFMDGHGITVGLNSLDIRKANNRRIGKIKF